MEHHHCHDESCSKEHCQVSCGCSCHEHEHQHFSDQLLEMADEAWMEVLKEKIKQKIEKETGQHLDQLASLVATANHNRWINKMGVINGKEDFKIKLDEYFKR